MLPSPPRNPKGASSVAVPSVVAGAGYERHQNVERFRRQRYGQAVAAQEPFARVETKRTELE
jgi:hypothetical protein